MSQAKENKSSTFDLSRVLFIIPNAFTLSSIFCGCFSIINLLMKQGHDVFYTSAIALFFAAFFDAVDGRVARLTKTQSDFGVQLDSLADMVSFGLAPAILLYKWALWPLGSLGMLAVFVYVACGAIRLARFNLTATDDKTDSRYFTGLPIPLAAAVLISLVVAHYKVFSGLPVQRHNLVFVIIISIGLLMVSNVQYWSFKKAKPTAKVLFPSFIAFLFLLGIGLKYKASISLVILIFGYVCAGLIRHAWLKLRKVG